MSAKAYIATVLRKVRNLRGQNNPSPEDRSESGAALVEFTILMPVFFLLLFGIVEFGSIIWSQNTMTTASREGARAAAVQNGTLANAQQKACQMLARSSAGQTFTVSATDICTIPPGATLGFGEVTVTITVSKAAASLFNTFFQTTAGGGLTASSWGGNVGAGATMRREGECTTALPAVGACSCGTAGGVPSGC